MPSALPMLVTDLESVVDRLHELYQRTSLLEERGLLGGAARIPDELARALACVVSTRNAAAYECLDVQVSA